MELNKELYSSAIMLNFLDVNLNYIFESFKYCISAIYTTHIYAGVSEPTPLSKDVHACWKSSKFAMKHMEFEFQPIPAIQQYWPHFQASSDFYCVENADHIS